MNVNWLVSYPRSGSTWVRLFFANLLWPEEPRGYKDTDYIVPDFHAINRWKQDLVGKYTKKLFLLKSHHPIMDEYFESPCIYVFRDPRDVVISEYHFEQWEEGLTEPFDEFFTRFVTGRTKFESWKMHVGFWALASLRTDIKYLVKYEDLWKDPFTEFMGMCEFLQYPAGEKEVLAAIDKCTFDKCVKISPQDNVDPRKRGLVGKPGGWKEVLTKEQQEKMWEWTGDLMERLGYEI